MVKRLLLKLFLVGAVCAVLLVVGLGTAGFLALRPPGFYSDLAANPPAAADAQAAEERIEQMREDFVYWRAQALQRQHPSGAEPGYQLENDLHTVRVSDAELNALLVAESSRLDAGELSDPRVRFEDDRASLAVTLATPAGDLVLSAAFAPAQPVGGDLRMRLVDARLGRLPLPVNTLSSWLPKQENRLSGALYLDTTGSAAELILRMDDRTKQAATPRSVRFTNGEAVVTLRAPRLAGE
ncbi:hypothetical protein KOR34_40430 [Posidoniimonas corsicana]|uniref:Uncharacterized protein n=1 Tax=Posidoniimonas corsicana TaxID=1938618 RepID=A0A5C5V1L7_9BACT|nr:hypothetical protein [Posidoniimonas corsicana]TWT32281.1 hypothetical protein KOR34_40430 [Posidoniimonas corsicana]